MSHPTRAKGLIYIYYHDHHQGVLTARILLNLSHHPSLLAMRFERLTEDDHGYLSIFFLSIDSTFINEYQTDWWVFRLNCLILAVDLWDSFAQHQVNHAFGFLRLAPYQLFHCKPDIDGTLTRTTTLGQSGLCSNVNDKVLHSPQSSRTGSSPSDAT